MGEYAKLKGTSERVKIGTCESMYYLRADQAEMVWPEHGSVDPIRDAAGIRFRFPFPNEDGIAPGAFEDDDKTVALRLAESDDAGFEHSSVQFKADAGYLVSLPCPESAEGKALPFTIHRNGFVGAVRLVQQRVWNGMLVIVCQCACGAAYRVETLETAAPYIRAALAEADRAAHLASISPLGPNSEDSTIKFWNEIARRIGAGYTDPPAWVARLKTTEDT